MSTNKSWLKNRNNEGKASDESNYEVLREFAQEEGNKFCFDCRQRGPNYINMTIGSFVCMRCSGLLRGLTPPHRVKSMSMATFTKEEIEFVKERGNDYCKQVWLALYEDSSITNTKFSPQEIRDFMIQVYERKRFFVDPKISGVKLRKHNEKENIDITSVDKTAESLFPKVNNNNSNNNNNEMSPWSKVNNNSENNDFVADFSKADIFVAGPNIVNNNSTTSVNNIEPFANFDNNPIFQVTNNVKPVVQSKLSNDLKMSAPSEDRYAALKDLDNEFKQLEQQPNNYNGIGMNSNGRGYGNGTNGLVALASSPSSVSSFQSSISGSFVGSPTLDTLNNNFSTNGGFTNNNGFQTNGVNSTPMMVNPFCIQTTANPWQTTFISDSNGSNSNPFRSQIPQAGVVNPYNTNPVQFNPFKVSCSGGANGFSNNPFL